MNGDEHAPVAIGLDLGTSGLKAVAVTEDGRVLARASRGYVTTRVEPGSAEQDPRDWMDACDEVLLALGREVAPQRWAAIGLSGMLPTLVSMDDDFTVVGPAITWEDGRAEPDAARILEALGEAALYRTTGQRLDARYLLPMFARRAGSAPSATRILGAKDYLLLELTGEFATDPSTATGFGCYDLRSGTWDAEIAATAGSPRLPALVPSSSAFPLLAARARQWGCPVDLPVVVGAADSVMGAYGLGISQPGRIGIIAGTSTVIIGWSRDLRFDPELRYLVTPMADGGVGLELDLMSTGSAFAWLAGMLGLGSSEELVELASGANLDESPLVLPYFGPGEQGALWDPNLTGMIEGLTLRTGRRELARGLLAGIVLEAARCVAVVREAQAVDGSGGGVILLTGSSGASELFRQDLADATGLAVHYDPGERDHSAVGAALFAGRSTLGWGDEPSTVLGVEVRPDPTRAESWKGRFDRHERARGALLPPADR